MTATAALVMFLLCAETNPRRLHEFEALLALSNRPTMTARETDATIAAAVSRGNDKDIELRKPFRKRNNDLFRTQTAFQLDNQEMLVRLRLRPAMRRVLTVEFRF